MSDYPMLISNKLHSFRNFCVQSYKYFVYWQNTKTVICIIVAVGWWLFNSFYLILWIGRGNGASGSKKF